MRQPLLSFLTSQVDSPPGGIGGHENRGRMMRPRMEVMNAPREKLFNRREVSKYAQQASRAFDEQDGESREKVMAGTRHVLEESATSTSEGP